FQYNRARYYAPGLERFISEDPLGFAGGDADLYGYVGGNPIQRSDPSGLSDVGCLHTPQPWPIFAPSSPLGCGGVPSGGDCQLWKCSEPYDPCNTVYAYCVASATGPPSKPKSLPPCELLASAGSDAF